MPAYVALLRGINVGGRNRVAMADLRNVVISLGHTEVATYIQSGNAVFTSTDTDTAAMSAGLEHAIAAALGVTPAVVVLSCAELAQVVADNPYADEPNPKAVHAVFSSVEPAPELLAAVTQAQEKAAAQGSSDQAQVIGRTLFLRTPDGIGRSDLAAALIRASGRAGPGQGTARNWATVGKLLDMCGDLS